MKKREIIAYITAKLDTFNTYAKINPGSDIHRRIIEELNHVLDFALDNKKSEKEKDWETAIKKQDEVEQELRNEIDRLERFSKVLNVANRELKEDKKIHAFNKNNYSER